MSSAPVSRRILSFVSENSHVWPERTTPVVLALSLTHATPGNNLDRGVEKASITSTELTTSYARQLRFSARPKLARTRTKAQICFKMPRGRKRMEPSSQKMATVYAPLRPSPFISRGRKGLRSVVLSYHSA